MMVKARIDKLKWVRCGNCGHKLLRVRCQNPLGDIYNLFEMIDIEIKCHSCKQLNELRAS